MEAIYGGIERTTDGDYAAMFIVSENQAKQLEKLHEKVNLEVEDYSAHRSLSANAFCWKMCTLIANKIDSDKDSVYKLMLKRYGQFTDIECNKDAAERVKGLFRYWEEWHEDFIGEYDTVTIRGYFGSSGYTVKEMQVFLNGICSEAKELDIPLISDDEFNRLIGEWEHEKKV